MPQRSPGASNARPKRLDEVPEQKAVPVRELYFSTLVRIPGVGGAATCIVAGKPDVMKTAQNVQYVDSIFMYNNEFIIDGQFFVPKTCGALFGWRF